MELKLLSPRAVPSALALAERYRLLNEPGEAESICRDILRVDSDNQDAIQIMLLALTDQFDGGSPGKCMAEADNAARRLRDEYKRLYYSGLIRERRAKAEIRAERPGMNMPIREWLREAMALYERAEQVRPSGQDEALLRWNACARIMMTLPEEPRDTQDRDVVQSE